MKSNFSRYNYWIIWGAVLAMSTIVAAAMANSQELPELNKMVVHGTYEQLLSSLEAKAWTSDELGSALIAAAGVNKVAQTELLIKRGADINYAVLGMSPLIIAAAEDSPDSAIILLENGADPDFKSMFDWRPLHKAITKAQSNDDLILILLEHGADINAITNLQITPLHRAAGFCLISAVNIFLAHGADTRLLDKYGQTAADRARKAGCDDVAAAIEKY